MVSRLPDHLPDLPDALAQELRWATCFLPPAQRTEIQAELAIHLSGTHRDALLRGATDAGAWDIAAQELRPLWRLAWGLTRVHMLTRARRWLLVALALGGVAYAVRVTPANPPLPAQVAQP